MCHRCIVTQLMYQAAERQKSEGSHFAEAINRENTVAIDESLDFSLKFGHCLDREHQDSNETHPYILPRIDFDIAGLFSRVATVKDMKTSKNAFEDHAGLDKVDTHENSTSEGQKLVQYPYDIVEVFKNIATVRDMKTSNFQRTS